MRRFLVSSVVALYRLYYGTLRVRCLLPDGTVIRAADHPLDRQVFALCERDTVALCGLLAASRCTVLVAHGRDGDWASLLLTRLGCVVVRGSTRRGGARALLTLLRRLDCSDDPLAIVVDGPLGPAGVAKAGALVCGLNSDRPVRALGVASPRCWKLPRTWSGLYFPLPFSTVVVTYDVATDTEDGRDIDAMAERLTRRLALSHQRASAAVER